ncbi:MAG: thioredoxin domain-containing protein [Syntrophotaleaceae bacterium]
MNHLERQEIVNRLSAIDTSKLPPDGGDEYNRLIFEKSPYLLQHATNPVDWFPWGEEAFEKARREDKPVLVSIGYSTCHWCHVMEEESFQDPEVGKTLNRHIVSIKVDREERPDLDNIYMAATQVLTGTAGWPLNIFLTPDKKPFFAATYLPRENQDGKAGIIEVIERISGLWKDNREDLLQTSEQVTSSLTQLSETAVEAQAALVDEPLIISYNSFFETFDKDRGGFGEAPKFPLPHNVSLLLRLWDRLNLENAHAMALRTLQHIRLGGIYDQIGFGVHRYSVDRFWRVPHFEKMLYDQALLILASLEALQASGDRFFRTMAEEVLEYVTRDLLREDGAFCSGEDADTEGEEGAFYLWTLDQLQEVLGVEHGTVFGHCYEVSWEGNFDGKNILRLEMDVNQWAAYFGIEPQRLGDVLALGRQKLFAARQQRIRPHRDDKVLTAWNGLTIAALARGSAVLDDPGHLQQATKAADFILDRMRDPNGRLLRRYREGEAAVPAFLEDYAFFCWGLCEIYQAGFETRYLKAALELTRDMEAVFSDGKGHYYDTAEDAEQVLVRHRTILDGAVPAGNSAAAYNLLRLGRLTGDRAMEKRGEEVVKASLPHAARYPTRTSLLRTALDYALGPRQVVVLAPGENPEIVEDMLRALRSRFLPRTLVLKNGPGAEDLAKYAPLVEGKGAINGRTAAYICRGQTCLPPVQSVEELVELLERRE